MRGRLVLLATLLLGLGPGFGCGHRGDPLPPRKRTPPAPRDFRLAQRGEALELRVTAPAASVEGVVYQSLEIEFLHADGQKDLEKAGEHQAVAAALAGRTTLALPLPAPGTLVRAAARAVVGREKGPRTLTTSLVAQAPLEAPRELAATLTEGGVSLSWRGPRPQEVSAAAPPPRLPSAARTSAAPASTAQSSAAKAPAAPASPAAATAASASPAHTAPAPTSAGSAPSAQTPAASAPAAPASAPPNAPAKAESPGAVPSAGPSPGAPAPAAPAGPRRSGFFVYRRVGGAEYGEPLAAEPLERRSLEDTAAPTGATACYVVRAVASVDPLVESAASNEACVGVRDITAPPIPHGLSVLPREDGLELLWGPSAAPDLAGYRIYRATRDGRPERVAEIAPDKLSWVDGSVTRGVVYQYSVSAFDNAGNESEASEAVEGSLP
ncbi:MAG TPA: fibronectin type III domain-containing protein [Vicinamibacteria bacterium]|nr:fibronectin type III domain-containing protein [Vicinamibacteria bacterium]